MKTLMAIGLTVVVLMFVSVAAFPQTIKSKTVEIQDDKGNVDIDTVYLSPDEQVQWKSKAHDTVYVVFYTKENHTPFKKAVFKIAPRAKPVPSGPVVKQSAGKATEYRYAAVGVEGSNDPRVIINRN